MTGNLRVKVSIQYVTDRTGRIRLPRLYGNLFVRQSLSPRNRSDDREYFFGKYRHALFVLRHRHALHYDIRQWTIGTVRRSIGDRIDDIHALSHLAEDRIEVWKTIVRLHDEELTAIGIRIGVRHSHGTTDIAGLI